MINSSFSSFYFLLFQFSHVPMTIRASMLRASSDDAVEIWPDQPWAPVPMKASTYVSKQTARLAVGTVHLYCFERPPNSAVHAHQGAEETEAEGTTSPFSSVAARRSGVRHLHSTAHSQTTHSGKRLVVVARGPTTYSSLPSLTPPSPPSSCAASPRCERMAAMLSQSRGGIYIRNRPRCC